MTNTTTAASNPVPAIDSAALPQTPADEWTQNTNGILEAHDTATLQNIPGSFPEKPAVARSGETLLATAKAYLRAMTNAAQAAKSYLPQGVTGSRRSPSIQSHSRHLVSAHSHHRLAGLITQPGSAILSALSSHLVSSSSIRFFLDSAMNDQRSARQKHRQTQIKSSQKHLDFLRQNV
ncbi:hypothetical protein DFH09DRAFT_1097486 [Mycena vulgaris]|nr:hypothetical protein DFH09DRAFT_1097486 [Mycena vulgaris]